MDQKTLFLLEKFDLMRLSRLCNIKNCKEIPDKEIVFFETDIITGKKTEFASLYFCNEHYNNHIDNLLNELNRICKPGNEVDKNVFDLDYTRTVRMGR